MQLISTPTREFPVLTPNRLPDNLICFSHLRWDFVFQRPQHLLTRLAESVNIFYLEEPVIGNTESPHYIYASRGPHITVITPRLPGNLDTKDSIEIQKALFNHFMAERAFSYGFWYYTPMALEFTRDFEPELTVFDCMDELSAFKFAPESIKTLEKELFEKADIVFTGGYSLFEAKKSQHDNIFPFPSSIDKSHFAKTRVLRKEQANHRVKLGFFGVIDERFDTELILGMAELRPDWEFSLVGPVVKIDPAILPAGENIHYLGPKNYAELPDCMRDWDLALIPFLLNESTRFISPTKTPEYLAAGLPVISTPIRDVINPYGKLGLVSIGQNAAEFVACAEKELNRADRAEWMQTVDDFLSYSSWDLTCVRMVELINDTLKSNQPIYNKIAQS